MKKILCLAATIVAILITVAIAEITLQERTVYKINGESFALSSIEEKQFLFLPATVERVYGYSSTGEIILFSEGKDYEIDYKRGTIKRTESSDIPNYNRHRVAYDQNGQFSFQSNPVRNPELNVLYQIYVDYTCLTSEVRIPSQISYLSETTQDKLINGGEIKIGLIGDSIAAGAQTTAQFFFDDRISKTFLGYLKEDLEAIYSCSVSVESYSQGGVGTEFLIENIDHIVSAQPDVVLIEFGMNDHINAGKVYEDVYRNTITNAIQNLKANGIDVILVGFFQQNKEWELEQEKATKTYNKILKKVSEQEHIYFADTLDAFEFVAKRKNIYEDVMADYMHHPTDFGHQIYLTCVLPAFITEEKTKAFNQMTYYLPIN